MQSDSIDAQQRLLVKRQELELLKKKRELKAKFGLAFYKPHPKQDKFHRMSKYRLRYVRTGNRFGKSDMGAAEDCAFALGYRPWIPEGDPARYEGIPRHSTRGCIVVQNWDKAKEIFTNDEPGQSRGKLFAFLPESEVVKKIRGRASAGYAEIVVKSKWGGHSTIRLATVQAYKQEGLSQESSDWDWIHIDEPCPEGMWKALWRGCMDRGGKGWFTCTPLCEMWINDYFIPDGRLRASADQGFVNNDHKIPRWYMTGSSKDNIYISEEDVDGFMEDLTPEERACREHGVPLALSGTIYKSFRPDEHIYRETPYGWKDMASPPKDYTVRVLIDPHPKTPDAVLFFATSPGGKTFIFNEIFAEGVTSETAKRINEIIDGYFVERFLVDPAAYIEDPMTRRCMADEFFEYGIPVEKAVKDLAYGIIKTDQTWRERGQDGYPTLFVSEYCRQFLWEIERYVWDPTTDKERPIDKDDHLMECLYRGVLTGLKYCKEQKHVPRFEDESITMGTWNNDRHIVAPLKTDLFEDEERAEKKRRFNERYPI